MGAPPPRPQMSVAEAATVLGVRRDAPWSTVRSAYRDQIRSHHPDRAGDASAGRAARIIEAFRTLDEARLGPEPPAAPRSGPVAAEEAEPVERSVAWGAPGDHAPPVARLDGDTLAVRAPGDETFRWLVEAAHDIGEVTYLDRSGPILEVLCRFEGEPATSLVVTLQGRGDGSTEAFCTVESIEARPAPPTEAVVDLLELALRRRQSPDPTD